MAARKLRTTPDPAARAVADKYISPKGGKGEPKEKAAEDYELSAASIAKGTPPPEVRIVRVAAPAHKFSPKEALFVEYYTGECNGNGAEAARKAGYPEKAARQTAYDLLTKPYIRDAIEVSRRERLARVAFTGDQLLLDLLREHRADIRDLFDDNGAMKPIKEWPPEFCNGLVAGFEVENLYAGTGESRVKVGEVVKFRMADRVAIKKMIGDHVTVQAFKKRLDVDVPEDSPLRTLAKQLNGTGLRPREIEGTARPMNGD